MFHGATRPPGERGDATAATRDRLADRHRGLDPPQFSVRFLMVALVGLCGLLACFRWLGPFGQFALVMAVLTVGAHVAGNAIGSRLRASSDEVSKREQLSGRRERRRRGSVDSPHEFAPSTRLAHRHPLARAILMYTMFGVVAGALFGGIGLAAISWEHATVATLGLGVAAAGVLGGFVGFGASSLISVARDAWREAAGTVNSRPSSEAARPARQPPGSTSFPHSTS